MDAGGNDPPGKEPMKTMLKAFDLKTGQEVKVGDQVTDFRGNKHTLGSIERANGDDHDGKVAVLGDWPKYARVYGLRVERVEVTA